MNISRSLPLQAVAAPAGQRTAISFDVDTRNHAVTVSVVDRRSGEVLQQMVYDSRVGAGPDRSRRTGALVDLHA